MDMRHRGGFLFRCVGDDEEYATGNKVEERTAACPRGNWSRIAADIDATATDEDGSASEAGRERRVGADG